jgi:hypothetical protein
MMYYQIPSMHLISPPKWDYIFYYANKDVVHLKWFILETN